MFNALSTGVTGFIGAGVKAAKDTMPTIPNPMGGGDKDEEDEMNALEAAANAKNPRPPPKSEDEEDDRASVASSGATSGADSPVSGTRVSRNVPSPVLRPPNVIKENVDLNVRLVCPQRDHR